MPTLGQDLLGLNQLWNDFQDSLGVGRDALDQGSEALCQATGGGLRGTPLGAFWNQHQSSLQYGLALVEGFLPGVGPLFAQMVALPMDTLATCKVSEAMKRSACRLKKTASLQLVVFRHPDVQRLAKELDPRVGLAVRAAAEFLAAYPALLTPICEHNRLPDLVDVLRALERAFALSQVLRQTSPELWAELAPLFAEAGAGAPEKGVARASAELSRRGIWTRNERLGAVALVAVGGWVLFLR